MKHGLLQTIVTSKQHADEKRVEEWSSDRRWVHTRSSLKKNRSESKALHLWGGVIHQRDETKGHPFNHVFKDSFWHDRESNRGPRCG